MPAFSGKAAIQALKAPPLFFNGSEVVLTYTPGTPTVSDVKDDGSLFVGIGDQIHTSPDGDSGNWTLRTAPNTDFQQALVTDGTSFVTCPLAVLGCWETTTPTSTWNARTVFGSGLFLGSGIFYDAITGLFIIYGTDLTNARLATSTDGITWTERTAPTDMTNINSVYRSSDNTLVALGIDGATEKFSTSTDGITWSSPATTVDTGTGAPQGGVYDAIQDRHYVVTGTEFGFIPNNSGPPEVADFTEIGTDEGSLVKTHLIQPNPNGPVLYFRTGAELVWSNNFSTVETQAADSIVTAYAVHFGFDGNYYICGRDASNAYIERMLPKVA